LSHVDNQGTKAPSSQEVVVKCNYASVAINLGTYNGSTYLEAFPVNVKNISSFLRGDDDAELFYLRACL